MSYWFKIIAAVLIGLALVPPGQAFGPDGHRIVGQIAVVRLTPAARGAVGDLIGEQALAEACNWPDVVRGQPGFELTGPLHYVNVPPGETEYVAERDCSQGNCVVAAIETFSQVLSDPGRAAAERAEALKFVCHFVADLHQPLHTGYAHDRGGNQYQVQWYSTAPRGQQNQAGQATAQSTRHADRRQQQSNNLHAVWDDELVARLGPWAEQAALLATRCQSYPDLGQPLDWFAESRRLVLKEVYRGPDLNEDYFERHIETVAERLTLAGCRLAGLLNQTLQ